MLGPEYNMILVSGWNFKLECWLCSGLTLLNGLLLIQKGLETVYKSSTKYKSTHIFKIGIEEARKTRAGDKNGVWSSKAYLYGVLTSDPNLSVGH
jgi:hypothetical protein